MKKPDRRILYTVFIAVGAVLILYEQSKATHRNMAILAVGFVLLMLGLYKATTQWIKDNKEGADKDDDEQEKH